MLRVYCGFEDHSLRRDGIEDGDGLVPQIRQPACSLCEMTLPEATA